MTESKRYPAEVRPALIELRNALAGIEQSPARPSAHIVRLAEIASASAMFEPIPIARKKIAEACRAIAAASGSLEQVEEYKL